MEVLDLPEAMVAVLFTDTADSTLLIAAAMRRSRRCQEAAPLREHPALEGDPLLDDSNALADAPSEGGGFSGGGHGDRHLHDRMDREVHEWREGG